MWGRRWSVSNASLQQRLWTVLELREDNRELKHQLELAYGAQRAPTTQCRSGLLAAVASLSAASERLRSVDVCPSPHLMGVVASGVG